VTKYESNHSLPLNANVRNAWDFIFYACYMTSWHGKQGAHQNED